MSLSARFIARCRGGPLHGSDLTSDRVHCRGYDWYGGDDPEWVWAGDAKQRDDLAKMAPVEREGWMDKPGGPAAPVTQNDPKPWWSQSRDFVNLGAIREHIALAVAELDRVAAHHYRTPLDPPLRLPTPAAPADWLVTGARVAKRGGDYTFEGVVRADFTKLSGVRRVVVENDQGILHILNPGQLEEIKND